MPKIPRLSPGWRHGLAVAAVCALFGMAASALLLREEREQLVAASGEQLAGQASVMARRLDSGLSGWATDVGLLARFQTFEQEPPDPAAARRLLEDLRLRSPTFSWIGFVGADGRVIAATGGLLEGVDVSARPWFRPGLAGLHLGDVHPAVLLARLLPREQGGGEDAYFVDAAAPVRARDGRVLGVVSGHLTWRWAEGVRNEVMSLTPAQFPVDLRILAVDGTVLLGPDGERGRPWQQDPALSPDAPWQEATRPDGRGVILGRARADGDPGRPSLGWTIVAQADRATVLARLDSFALWLGLGTAGLAALGGILAGLNAHRIDWAMHRVLGTAGGTGRNDMVARLEALRDQAWRDPLTGLLNRAGFAAWCKTHPAVPKNCAVVALDLDGFKPINDRHGHAAGDEVLRAIGTWLQGNLRAEDAAVRTGGDEFVLVFPSDAQRGGQSALEVGARLHAMLRTGVPTSAGLLTLGCSLGLALVPQQAPTVEAAIALADAGLYEAKRRKNGGASGRSAAVSAK